LDVTQRIKIRYQSSDLMKKAVNDYSSYIENETLTLTLEESPDLPEGYEFKVGDQFGKIQIIVV